MDKNRKEELDKKWKAIAAKAVTDEIFKKSLVDDPIGVMQEHGLKIPEGTEAKIGTGNILKLITVKNPPDELMEEVTWWTWRLTTIRDFGRDDDPSKDQSIATLTSLDDDV